MESGQYTQPHTRTQTDTHSSLLTSLLLPSQLDHDNPLHPGNMSSLIRLVSAALEKPQAPCGEGPTREASAATRQTGPAGPEAEGKEARRRLDGSRRTFNPARVTFSALSPILVGKHLQTIKIKKTNTQFVIPSILHTVKSHNQCL